MTKISGSDAIFQVLYDWGIDHIYGFPGGSFDSTINAIHNWRDKIKFIEVRHEDNTTETLKVTPKETTDEKGNKSRVFGVTIYQETYYGVGKAISYAASKFESIYQSMFTIIYGLFIAVIKTK